MIRWLFATAAVGGVIVACSGGGGSIGSSGPVTSLPESQDVATLTPGDQRTLCEDVGRYIQERLTPESTRSLGCSFAASIAGGFAAAQRQDARAACQKAYDDCLAAPATPDAGAIRFTQTFGDCRVSTCRGIVVGDYTACAREYVDRITSFRYSCDNAGTDAGADAVSFFTPGSACERVIRSCDD